MWIVVVAVVLAIALIATIVVVNERDLRRLALPVPGERDLAVLRIDRIQAVKVASHGSIAPTLGGIDEVRVTSRRLIFTARGAPQLVVNLEPAPPGEDAPLIGNDRRGTVITARRDAIEADFDRVALDTRGLDGRYQMKRLLLQLAEGRRLEELIRRPPPA